MNKVNPSHILLLCGEIHLSTVHIHISAPRPRVCVSAFGPWKNFFLIILSRWVPWKSTQQDLFICVSILPLVINGMNSQMWSSSSRVVLRTLFNLRRSKCDSKLSSSVTWPGMKLILEEELQSRGWLREPQTGMWAWESCSISAFP